MQCPICKKPVDETQLGRPGSVAPFCSERCKLIDLGRWLTGKYQIPVEADAELAEEPATGAEGSRRPANDEGEE